MKSLKMMMVGLLVIALMGCQKVTSVEDVPEVKYENEKYQSYVGVKDIKSDVASLSKKYKGVFSKYIQYTAPNGKPITILAQDQVEDEMLLNAYNILSFYLTNHSSYDKADLANRIAESGQVIVMPNGKDGDKIGQKAAEFGQPVYQLEAPTIGGQWYLNNNYEHRDAAYEEIFHFVHDNGIGTISNKGVLPNLQQSIYTSTMNALPKEKDQWGKTGIWGLGSKDWLIELEKEGSLEQEYIASVIDVYYGLWRPWQEGQGGMWGVYAYKTRAELKTHDPDGYKIVDDFLGGNLTFMARIDPSFEGTFKMTLNEDEAYTFKSQYLTHARLTGKNNSSLLGNEKDNILIGNEGHNKLDGAGGYDVVQFSGSSGEYVIEKINDQWVITDLKNRDGITEVFHVEVLRFTDKDIVVK